MVATSNKPRASRVPAPCTTTNSLCLAQEKPRQQQSQGFRNTNNEKARQLPSDRDCHALAVAVRLI